MLVPRISEFSRHVNSLLRPKKCDNSSILSLSRHETNLTYKATPMASDIRTSELKEPVDVAEYLFRRLHEVGIRGVHGVPGDYNLVLRPIRKAHQNQH